MIDFSPLWETMKERNITQYYLLQNGIDFVEEEQKHYIAHNGEVV